MKTKTIKNELIFSIRKPMARGMMVIQDKRKYDRKRDKKVNF